MILRMVVMPGYPRPDRHFVSRYQRRQKVFAGNFSLFSRRQDGRKDYGAGMAFYGPVAVVNVQSVCS